ncbi:MAG: hypothetical protein ACREBB_11925 [Nitrosotalea sp.]
MHKLILIEIIFTIGIAAFFVSSEHFIDSSKPESLYNYAVSASSILWMVSLPLVIGKFVLLKKRLSEMSEHRAPIRSAHYRTKVIVSAVQSIVSMFTYSVSAFAMVMSLFVAFGVNSEPFQHSLYMDHVATYAIFPILDVAYLVSNLIQKK